VLEGPADAVDAMLEFLRAGPGHASVSRLEVADEEPAGLSGFSVR
jgi:acylphosphatase